MARKTKVKECVSPVRKAWLNMPIGLNVTEAKLERLLMELASWTSIRGKHSRDSCPTPEPLVKYVHARLPKGLLTKRQVGTILETLTTWEISIKRGPLGDIKTEPKVPDWTGPLPEAGDYVQLKMHKRKPCHWSSAMDHLNGAIVKITKRTTTTYTIQDLVDNWLLKLSDIECIVAEAHAKQTPLYKCLETKAHIEAREADMELLVDEQKALDKKKNELQSVIDFLKRDAATKQKAYEAAKAKAKGFSDG